MGNGLKRFQDWPERLNAFLSQDLVFNWCELNCVLFAAAAIEAQTGVDFVGNNRGFKTKRGAVARLKKVCGGGVEDAARMFLGEPYPSVNLAKRGDVVSCDVGDGVALGVCVGAKALFISENEGKVSIPLTRCRYAWKV